MTNFEKFTSKVLKSIFEIDVENEEEYRYKLAIIMYFYHSLESEEVFNKNCIELNKTRKK